MRQFFKFFLLFILLSCSPVSNQVANNDTFDRDRSYDRDRDTDTDRNRDTDRDRQSDNRRSLRSDDRDRDREIIIRGDLDPRYEGFAFEDDVSGPCKQSSRCREVCREWYFNRSRRTCERSSEAVVESVEETLIRLKSISDPYNFDVNYSVIYAIVKIDEDILVDLIEGEGSRTSSRGMSEGSLKSFLAWVAATERVAEIFREEDNGNDILETAFEQLGRKIGGNLKHYILGLNANLTGEGSFFSITARNSNQTGFELAYEVLEDKAGCGSDDRACKMRILCAAEPEEKESPFGTGRRRRDLKTCKTTAVSSGAFTGAKGCYAHGASAWGYLNQLIENEDIDDDSLKGIDSETCEHYCGKGDCHSR